MLKTRKILTAIALSGVLGSNVLADETLSSQAIYDSKTKMLYLEGILVPFINELTGKISRKKGIFDAELKEKRKLLFELNFDSIKFKDMFDGEKVSGYILYNPKTRSVNIPCFKATTTSQFGDGFEGDIIYYQDVIMTSRHITSAMFGIEDLTEADSCESSVEPTLTTTPTTTIDDTVEVEVNGKVGTTVFVNGVDSGKTIDSTGKVKVTLDTSGDDGDKSFSITLKDDKGNESEALSFTITKQNTLTEGLVAHYEFEDNANDSSGNANHGTEHGGLGYIKGVIGKAGRFDGVDDWIDVKVSSLPINNNSRTISAWVSMKNGADTNIDQLIVHYGGNATNSGFGLQYGLGNAYVFGIWNLGCTYDVTIDNKNCTESNLGYPNYVKQNKNYHLVALYDGTNEKIFINGILQGNKEQSLNTNLSNLYIGAKNSSYLFNGIIDDLRIYNRALSEYEIKQLYKMGQQ